MSDGTVARLRKQQTQLGGLLDIVCDFTIFSLLPIALAYSTDKAWLAVALLLASFHVNNTILVRIRWRLTPILMPKQFYLAALQAAAPVRSSCSGQPSSRRAALSADDAPNAARTHRGHRVRRPLHPHARLPAAPDRPQLRYGCPRRGQHPAALSVARASGEGAGEAACITMIHNGSRLIHGSYTDVPDVDSVSVRPAAARHAAGALHRRRPDMRPESELYPYVSFTIHHAAPPPDKSTPPPSARA